MNCFKTKSNCCENSGEMKCKKRQKLSTYYADRNGYTLEKHEVVTEDGYILCLERLRRKSESSPVEERKPAVLLVHGMLSRGDHWCLIEPEVGLPYKLVDSGWDVWLPNLRGSGPSQKHTYLRKESKSFWDFSFHEIGIFDLPAVIGYVLELTGNENLSYIGHSMGSAVFFVLLSEKPEFCEKINVMIALAPAVYGTHVRKFGFKMMINMGNLMSVSSGLRRRELGDKSAYESAKPLALFSNQEKAGAWLVHCMGRFTGGIGKQGISKERFRMLSTEWPSPVGMKVACHGFQNFRVNKARQFDYGRKGNLKIYGQPKPPQYKFENAKVPVIFFSSEGDELCRPSDVATLSTKLPNLIAHYNIPDENLTHMDFCLGKNAEGVFNKVLEILAEWRRTAKGSMENSGLIDM